MTDSEPTMYRYAVVGTWGDVPEQISDMVGSASMVLLYPEFRGEWSEQSLYNFDRGELVGGWAMEYRGLHEPAAPTSECGVCGDSDRHAEWCWGTERS